MKSNNGSIANKLFSILVLVLFVGCGFLLFYNRQLIVDRIIVWNYQPSSEVENIKNSLALSDKGEFLFYASQPAINDADNFNVNCNKTENTTAILGCYNKKRIYIYNVTDSKLAGIKEVTSAHEMLHAVYDRLSENEKKSVDALIEAEYAKIADNEDLKTELAYYQQNEPTEIDNELHSIFATQFAELNPELEEYYQQYFSNRQTVVNFYNQYISVFKELDSKANTIMNQITALETQIQSTSNQYSADVNQLSNDIDDFNNRADAGDFTSMSQFYSQRNTLVTRTNKLETTRQSILATIEKYNSLVTEYNSIVTESEHLQASMNSSIISVPSL